MRVKILGAALAAGATLAAGPALAVASTVPGDTAPPGTLATNETTDGDHGRIEVRRAFVSHDVGWITSDRRFPGEWNFQGLAMLGMIALGGMIMRNTVILVDQIEQDIKAGEPPWVAIREATVRRFRPIMLTAAAAMLAMIPLTRNVLWGPMAFAIMGGLLVATVLTVLFVPALYAAWFRVKQVTMAE